MVRRQLDFSLVLPNVSCNSPVNFNRMPSANIVYFNSHGRGCCLLTQAPIVTEGDGVVKDEMGKRLADRRTKQHVDRQVELKGRSSFAYRYTRILATS